MSFQVPAAFVQQYSTNVQMLLQQKGGRLRACVELEKFKGQAASAVEQFGPVTPAKNLARHSITPIISTPQSKRWVYPNDYDWADLIDNEDRLRMLIDPQGPYSMNAKNAMARAEDEEIAIAFFGTSQTGQNGTTPVTFPGGQIVAVNVGTSAATAGMNIAKLRAAKKLLLAAGVDIDADELYCAITSVDHDNLLNEAQAISLDYNDKPILVDGRIKAFMGFNFVQFEFIDSVSYPQSAAALVNGSGYRLVPAWSKKYMKLGMWNEVETTVDRRPDLRNSVQIYTTGTYGGTRLQEKGIVQMLCN
jgi:Phage capsid protein